ncbi:TPA: lipopolysaccharide biosynthesis protein [Klebsiella pneumoniae]
MTNKSNLKNRLIKGVGANAYGQAITVLIQLVSVPFFIQHWGISIYGEWLILSALPAYLSMSDFGLGAVAGNSMVIKMAQNDKAGALAIYRSVSCFNAGMSLLILLLSTVLLFMTELTQGLGIHQLAGTDIKWVLLLLTFQVLVGLQGSILSAGYRAVERYAEGTALANTSRLIEWGFGMAMLLSGGGVVGVAAGMLSGRLFGYGIAYIRLQRLEPEFYFSVTKGDRQVIREMLTPGIAFLAFPLGLALSIQGMTLAIGSVLGAVAVAQFSVLRTVSRVLVQLVTVVNHATWPEISRSFGAGDLALARKLHVNSCRLALFIGVVCILGMLVFGDMIFNLWLGKSFNLPFVTFLLLLVVALVNISSQASWVVLMATNQHRQFAILFILASCTSIGLAFLTMPIGGVNAAALALLLAEIIILVTAVKKANGVLQDSVPLFLGKLVGIKA